MEASGPSRMPEFYICFKNTKEFPFHFLIQHKLLKAVTRSIYNVKAQFGFSSFKVKVSSSLLLVAVINTRTKSNSGKKEFI